MFQVHRCADSSGLVTPSSSAPSGNTHRRSRSVGHTDSSLIGSYRQRTERIESASARFQTSPETRSRHEPKIKSPVWGSASVGSSMPRSESGKLLNVSSRSLRDRLQTGPSHWEQIHNRVQKILQTHRTSWEPRGSCNF